MKEIHNKLYEAPILRELEVQDEGVICASGDPTYSGSFDDYEDGTFTW